MTSDRSFIVLSVKELKLAFNTRKAKWQLKRIHVFSMRMPIDLSERALIESLYLQVVDIKVATSNVNFSTRTYWNLSKIECVKIT